VKRLIVLLLIQIHTLKEDVGRIRAARDPESRQKIEAIRR
jgi:hypothetical protein